MLYSNTGPAKGGSLPPGSIPPTSHCNSQYLPAHIVWNANLHKTDAGRGSTATFKPRRPRVRSHIIGLLQIKET